jgi:hypothetical protein
VADEHIVRKFFLQAQQGFSAFEENFYIPAHPVNPDDIRSGQGRICGENGKPFILL